ncbi:MAG: hypothetical protein ASARMPRED_000047 [Alectoria sarmentosa]|nr:MAG: hypothetical protein ASARMPRED_000047 [Alectoria sarmentosa]
MTDLRLKTLVAPTASLQAQEPAELTSFPIILHRFMEYPLEIRLLIYNELITQHVDLYRPKYGFCPERARDYEPNSALFKSTNCANLAHTQILRTSKQVYSETLPILYSKNKVHMTCLDCERTGFILVPLWDFLVKPHDSPIEPIGHYHRHVKSIAVIDTKEVTLYLGCDKYCASNTVIEQILAGPVFEDKRRPFEVKAWMDLAGVSNV